MAGKAGLSVIGDYALNLLNSDALAEAASLGIKQAVISFELSMNSIAALGSYLPYGYLVYGHLPLMTFRNCPGKTPKGCSSHPCTLTDRKGNSFTLDCFGRRFSQLLNPIPLRLEKGRDFLADASFHLLRFTDESDADCAKILRCWKEGTGSADKRTTGLYYRKLL